jgi:dTDP-4-amino-4,6-dideoxy-D-glucose acyltransferase
MTSFYSEEELSQLEFKSIGENVLISRKANFYGISRISIGNNVRIDDFCVLTAGKGGIQLGNYVHLAFYSLLQGQGKIMLKDFSGIASRVSVYSSSDDYFGEYMTNPTIPRRFIGEICGDVTLCKHVIVGSGSVILPGVTLHEGVAVGALSLVNKDCEAFYLYKGNPAKKIFKRSRNLLNLEKEFLRTLQ